MVVKLSVLDPQMQGPGVCSQSNVCGSVMVAAPVVMKVMVSVCILLL